MQNVHKTLLRQNNYYLLCNLELDQEFISVLERSKTLLASHIETINTQESCLKKIDKFLDILPKRGSKAFDSFLEALSQSNQPYIRKTLMLCLDKPVLFSQESVDIPDTVNNHFGINTKRSLLLINISNRDDKELERSGSMKDLQDCEKFFVEELNYILFEDQSHEDLEALQIHKIVKRFVAYISSESVSQVLFIIMSHGEADNHIVGQDGTYVEIQRILKYFSDPLIANVFKVIVFACCRGPIESVAIPIAGMTTDTTEQVAANIIMNRAENYELSHELGCFGPPNSVVLYSTQQNFVSYRVEDVGTVFIQALLSVLKRSSKKKSIRQLVLEIRPEMRILFPQFDQMPDIKENYFADFYF